MGIVMWGETLHGLRDWSAQALRTQGLGIQALRALHKKLCFIAAVMTKMLLLVICADAKLMASYMGWCFAYQRHCSQ